MHCEALSCFDAEAPIIISIEKFSIEIFSKMMNTSLSTGTYEICLVDIQINFAQKSFTVLFGNAIELNHLTTNRQIYIDTHVILNTDQIKIGSNNNIINHIQFACNVNDCNREFVFRHFEWLLEMDYKAFLSKINPIVMKKKENSVKCTSIEQKHLESCMTGVCFLEYSMTKDKIKQGCENNSDIQPALHLVTYMTVEGNRNQQQTATVNFTISYWCQSTGCNNEITSKQVITTVEDNYNMVEMQEMLRVAHMEYWIEEETTNTDE